MPRFTALCLSVALICAVVMSVPSAATAQNQARVYLAVADQAGQPVLDLSADDFELSLDGVPLTLASVELDDVPPRIALLVDTGERMRELNAVGPLREGLDRFLRTLAPHLEVGLFTLAPNLQMRADFTADRAQLITEADRVFTEGGYPRVLDGFIETAERLEPWEESFEARDPWTVYVLVAANGDDGSSFVGLEQYNEFVGDLMRKHSTVHAVVLTAEGNVQATTMEATSLARAQPLLPGEMPDRFAAGSLYRLSENTQEAIFQVSTHLTESTGGRFRSINATTGLTTVLATLAEEMNDDVSQVSARYRVLYELPADTGDAALSMQIRDYDIGPVTLQQFTDRTLSTSESAEAEALRQEAEGGNVQGMRDLAELYLSGRGVRRDPEEAVRWIRRAADLSDAVAQNELGFLYSAGLGVERDQAEAVRWFRLSADQGETTAQFNLGLRYDKGEGVAQDLAEAARRYRQAGEQGHAGAQFHLGGMHDEGRGVEKDADEAVHWYRLAAQQGHVHAQFNLGAVFAEGLGEPAQAVGWYRLAGNQGHPAAQNNLGLMYGRGLGVPPNDAEAVRWYRRAAEQGGADAQFNLGAMYAQGRGVAQDLVTAYAWIVHAIEGAPADAIDRYQNARDAVGERMTAEELEEAENLSRLLPSPRPASP